MTERPTTRPMQNPPDFGKNVIVLDHTESAEILAANISRVRQISSTQTEDGSEFAQDRYAILFKASPEPYDFSDVALDVGYYMTVHGLGTDPDQVVVNGQVRSPGSSNPATPAMALNNFWRGIENLAVKPPPDWEGNPRNTWAVSQATFMRRVHMQGKLDLFAVKQQPPDYPAGEASGGFIADSKIDNTVYSGSQQQFLTRNVSLAETAGWDGGVWNMVFVGDRNPPNGSWADQAPSQQPANWDKSKNFPADWRPPPYTTVYQTPVIREKPYLVCDPSNGKYSVVVPSLRKIAIGASWTDPSGSDDKARSIPLSQFFVAKAGTLAATASELNKRLNEGYHLLLTPGVYHLDRSLMVDYKDTVILGIGMATLIPDYGTPAMLVADVDGVSVSGLIFDAGPVRSSSLLVVGYNSAHVLPGADHRESPTALFDCSARVGGEGRAVASNCFTINSNDVILDNIWLWRADHGRMGTHDPSVVGWNTNVAENGLTVNGDRVVAYGLFVEHFQGYHTIWNGNDGQVLFYQSEIPYDVPDQDTWRWQPGKQGCASYKVSDQVSSHLAMGLGVYCNFWYYDIHLDNAIEVPDLSTRPNINIENACTVWLDGMRGSGINHVVGGKQSSGWAIKDPGAAVLSRETMGPSRVLKVEIIAV